MLPHTHVRGKRWNYEAPFPTADGDAALGARLRLRLADRVRFKQPLKLPKGTTIHATAWYDNSAANKSNPDPTKDVWWGDQTWEEMMFTSFTWHVPAGGNRRARCEC